MRFPFLMTMALGVSGMLAAEPDEAQMLMQKGACVSCHHQSQKRMGPSYQEMADKHKDDPGAAAFFKDVIKNGSKNRMMPATRNLSDQEATTIAEWIQALSGGGAPGGPQEEFSFSPDESSKAMGKKLFIGEASLSNGGPSCLSCHHVQGVSDFGGGTFASDLTGSYEKFQAESLLAGIKSAAFPVMREIYKDKPITEEESHHLTAYLSTREGIIHEGASKLTFVISGAVMFLAVLGLMFMSKGEAKKSVRKRLIEKEDSNGMD